MNSKIRFHMLFNREDLDEMAKRIDMAETRKEGMTVGKGIGKVEGTKETKTETVINMLKNNLPLDLIEKCTIYSTK